MLVSIVSNERTCSICGYQTTGNGIADTRQIVATAEALDLPESTQHLKCLASRHLSLHYKRVRRLLLILQFAYSDKSVFDEWHHRIQTIVAKSLLGWFAAVPKCRLLPINHYSLEPHFPSYIFAFQASVVLSFLFQLWKVLVDFSTRLLVADEAVAPTLWWLATVPTVASNEPLLSLQHRRNSSTLPFQVSLVPLQAAAVDAIDSRTAKWMNRGVLTTSEGTGDVAVETFAQSLVPWQ